MDPRTRFILYQLLNRGILEEINGCVSTGKEVASFIGITLGTIAIIGLAVFLIKKYIIKRI